jgi:ADP-heptose:LPS heptosyltransferase
LAEGSGLAASVHAIDRGFFRALFERRADDRELRAFLAEFNHVVAWSQLPLLREKLGDRSGAIEASPFPPEGVHAAEHLVRTLAPLGIRGPASAPSIVVQEKSRHEAQELLGSFGVTPGRFVAIHPSSGSPRTNWPLKGFERLARLVERDGWPLVWVEGEADGLVVKELAGLVPAPVARGLSLPVLSGLLSSASLYIGNDSGVSHLAAAVLAPTVTLFGPTDPRSWAPLAATVVDFRDSPERVWAKALERFHVR